MKLINIIVLCHSEIINSSKSKKKHLMSTNIYFGHCSSKTNHKDLPGGYLINVS